MIKKNKLYTVNKFNRPLFMPDKNLFPDGGFKLNNPLDFKEAFKGSNMLNSFKSAGLGAAAGAIGGAVGDTVGGLIGGGLQSGAGKAISGFGKTIGGAVGQVNPLLGAAVTAATGIIGGGVNALVGTKVDQEKLNANKEGTTALNSFTSNAASLDDIRGPQAQLNVQDAFRSGLLNKGWAKKRNAEQKEARLDASGLALRSIDNNAENLMADSLNNELANYSAFGGPLDMGAINYDFMTDYLIAKNKKADNSSQMSGIFSGYPSTMFAFGGDIQTNSADFPTGLVHIDAGQSHEQNPNDGVQLGTDASGVPNLVEEGEVVFNDYVFSNRIPVDQKTKEKFHLSKKKEITYADLAKKLEKEISERPADPISEASFKAQMQQLEEQQERQKAEIEVQRAKEAFEALSPEEQTALMQRAAQEEQIAQQAAMQQEAMAQQEITPEEVAMAQQQMADGSEAAIGQEPQINCFGGRINRFDNGGQAYTKMLNSLGFHTQKEFDDWAKENNIDFGDIWKYNPNTLSIDILGKLWSNEQFKEALKKKNPALAHAFETKGYDFGTYIPTSNSRATIQSISKGNWKATNGQGWFGSEDLAFKQATEGMSENEIKALTTEQLAERMAKTDAYKNTSKWLENSDNALMYLNTLLNDPDTPDVAKKHALQYVKDGKWKDDYKYNYNDVFGKVRSTNPGTYWHTAMEANRGNEANNFVINEDGSIEPILGNVPTDWTSAGNYSWADENNDYTYNYYKRPAVAAKPEVVKTPEEKEAEETTKNLAPKHRPEWLRYAGLFGPAIGLGMMAAGVGKPDYKGINAAVSGAGNAHLADYQPIGDYLTYRPMDVLFEQNKLDSQARATDRAILNSGANQSSKAAALLASGLNSQIASGELYRKGLEYNDALRERVTGFNRGTNQFNAEAYNRLSQFNADAKNRAAQTAAGLALQAEREKLDADAGWYNSLYGNLGALFEGLSNLGTENARHNAIARMAADGLFGNLGNSYSGKGYVKTVSAEGGKVSKKKNKRGLTF